MIYFTVISFFHGLFQFSFCLSKFLPLSEYMCGKQPLLAMKRWIALMAEPIVKDEANSRWIALVRRQVNITSLVTLTRSHQNKASIVHTDSKKGTIRSTFPLNSFQPQNFRDFQFFFCQFSWFYFSTIFVLVIINETNHPSSFSH